MDAAVEGPTEDEGQIQDLNIVGTSNWPSDINQGVGNNNSTLLYIAVEYVKGYKGQENSTSLSNSSDTFTDFTPHVSPLDPNMSSVARYSPVPVQYEQSAANLNPVVIHQLVTPDTNVHNENFVNHLNSDGQLENLPTVLCGEDIREVGNQYLIEDNVNMVGDNENLQMVTDNEQQEVELLITDQATGISYTVNAQELLVERCLEDSQHLLEALAPNNLLESDLLSLDDSTLKSELNDDIIDPVASSCVDAQVVNNYISSLSTASIKNLNNAEDEFRIETRRSAQGGTDPEEQLLSCVYSISDKPILSRAVASLPESYLTIGKVDGENAVFAKKPITKCTQFGPLEGVLIHHEGNKNDNVLNYLIEIEDTLYEMDTSNENTSNWMSFVRRAQNFAEQNLIITQENNGIYFTTTNHILPKQELKVGYSATYGNHFGLPILKQLEIKTWPCYECPAKFATSEELQRHLDVHDEVKDENLKPKKKLSKKKHRYVKKTQVEAVECNICHEWFYSYVNYSFLKNHLTQKHLIKDIMVDDHFTAITNYKCDDCDLGFRSIPLLKIHNLSHDPDSSEEQTNHICPQCQRKFPTQKQLVAHVGNHALPTKTNNVERIKCPVCYKMFARGERLQKHMLVHGSEESKPLQCKLCNKRFLNNSALACHLKTHSAGKKAFECPICRESFDHVLKLKLHVPKHCHNNQYTCPHCKKVFKKYSIIRKHIRAFHCERKHTCQHCAKMFPTLDKLKMHLLRHSDLREFLCADCGKQFKRKDKLKEHCKRMHSEERENAAPAPIKSTSVSHKKFTPKVEPTDFHRFIYKCHACLVGFKRRGMLVNHLAKRHPDIRPDSVPELNLPILQTTRDYYCQYCDKVYKSSSKRKAHILKNHPGAALPMSNRKQSSLQEVAGLPNPTFSQTVGSITTRPQSCSWCHKQYASKAKLLQHQKKKHAEQLVSQQKTNDYSQENGNTTELEPMTDKLDGALKSDMILETCAQELKELKVPDINITDIMSSEVSNGVDGYGIDSESKFCSLPMNEDDMMETNDLENPNSHLYHLLTTNSGMLPPR